MKQPTVTCPKCNGSGKVDLDGVLAATLEIVRLSKGADVFQVHSAVPDKVSVTAINNRLEDLRRLGLVFRNRVGRRWIYHYTKLKPKTS